MSNLEDYQFAALALDAYQRGYFAGLPDQGAGGDGLGSTLGLQVAGGELIATARDLDLVASVAADFYAVAYLIGGEVVISYRGSDHLNWEAPFGMENWPDLPLMGADGADVYAMLVGQIPDQVKLALDFFNHVHGLHPTLPITLTGHSLGGALAATVADVKNVNAIVFDNTSYLAVVSTIIQQVSMASSGAYSDLKASVFNGSEPWTDFRQGEITKIALEGDIAGVFRRSDTDVDNVDMGTPLDAVSAHIQGLLVLALYARGKHGENGYWVNAANAVFTQLSNNATAAALGIAAANGNPASGVMKDMIASTVLPGNDNPFGNAAADSLINDMNDIGQAWGDVDLSWWVELAVRYSAFQAKHGASGGTPGTIYFDQVTETLVADLRSETWTFNGTVTHPSGSALDFSSFLDDGELDAAERASLNAGPGHVEYHFQAIGVGGMHAVVGYSSTDYAVQVNGTAVNDFIDGTGGNEQFFLGAGDDRFRPDGGVNWVDGGEGVDTLVDSYAWSNFEITFHDDKYYFALRGSGADPRIHVVQNVELFQLAGHEFNVLNVLNTGPSGSEFVSGGVFSEGSQLGGGAEIARLHGFDGNAFDILSLALHADSLRYFYLEGNVVRARHAIDLDWSEYSGFLGVEGLGDLENGVSASTWWTQDADFMDSHYVVKVYVTDTYGASALTHLVLDVENSAPVISLPNVTFPENAPAGRVLGTVSGHDPDWPSVPLTWSLSGSAAHLFAISSAGVLTTTAPMDYEQWAAEGFGEVFVTGTDRTGLSTSRVLAFNVTNVNEAPTALNWTSGGSVMENAAAYTTVGTLVASDPENNVVSYKISGWSAYFEVLTRTQPDGRVGMTLRTRSDAAIDYEALGPSTNVLIEARDAIGAVTVFSVPVTIIDVPEIDGTGGVDQLVGTVIGETIHGWNGDDHIWGMEGDDLIYGDVGNDTLYAGEGRDILYGGAENDIFVLDTGDLVRDIFYGGHGTDIVRAQGAATVYLTAAAITAARAEFPTAPSGNLFAMSTETSSALVSETEIIRGGTGSSIVVDIHPYHIATVYGIATVDFIAGAHNEATFNNPYLSSLNFFANEGYWHAKVGTTSFDGIEIWNLGSARTIVKFIALHDAGTVMVDGGLGADSADFSAYIASHTYDMNASALVVGQVTIKNFEFIVAGSGDDTFIGGLLGITFNGGAGRDVYVSREGTDYMINSDHAVLDYSGSNAGVTVQNIWSYNVASYHGTGGHAQGDRLEMKSWDALVEIIGSEYNDNLWLSHSGILLGGHGNDTLQGSGYNDTLDGGTGFDTLKVSGGNDTLIFSSTGGRLNYGAASSSIVDLVAGVATATINGTFKTDMLEGRVLEFTDTWGTDIVTGTDLSETLYFSGGNDTFITSGGQRDTIYGLGSGDTIRFMGGPASLAGIAASQVGFDVLLDFLGGSILLKGTAMSQWQNIEYEFG